MKKNKALLLADSSALNLKVLYCLYPVATAYVMPVDKNNMAAQSRHSITTEVLPADYRNNCEPAVAHINSFCREKNIDIIIAGDMGTSAFLAENQHKIDNTPVFACSSGKLLEDIHDKWSFARKLQSENISTPLTALIESAESLSEAEANHIGFPMMVKPLNCESSHGVVKIDSFRELSAYLKKDIPYNTPPLIMQKFIEGQDVDISLYAAEGKILASAVQYWSDNGTLVFREDEEMLKLASDIIRIFNFDGVAHFDMRRDGQTGKLYAIECNPRFWYTIPAAMWTGLNFVEVGINATHKIPYQHIGPATGPYRLPGDVVRALLKPARLFQMSGLNWKGFFQPVLDPIPHIRKFLSDVRS